MNNVVKKFKNITYSNEKARFLVFVVGLFFILFLATYLLRAAYARYEVRAKINANIDKALYIFEDEKINFNLEPLGIVPRDDPYTYKFSISNFNTSKQSDVDILYTLRVRTTTNLPINIKLYRNELFDDPGAVNLFSGADTKQDADGAWYRIYDVNDEYQFLYENKSTDVYTLVIEFPTSYAANTVYANYIESIEVYIDSKQLLQGGILWNLFENIKK